VKIQTRVRPDDTVIVTCESKEWGKFKAEAVVEEILICVRPMEQADIRYKVRGYGHHTQYFSESDLEGVRALENGAHD
jgi:hypothetical protein